MLKEDLKWALKARFGFAEERYEILKMGTEKTNNMRLLEVESRMMVSRG